MKAMIKYTDLYLDEEKILKLLDICHVKIYSKYPWFYRDRIMKIEVASKQELKSLVNTLNENTAYGVKVLKLPF